MNLDLISYYKDRAKEYEKVYAKPERQEELALVEKALQDIFKDKSVLEIACGTGFWTEKIANAAKSIVATDVNEAVIEIAKSKYFAPAHVEFRIVDLYDLKEENQCENLFGGFIWSHIPLQELERFIEHCNILVKPGGTVCFIDNNYVEGSSSPITESDGFGNTYQTRKLEDGTSHKVLKNFPKQALIEQILANEVKDLKFKNLEYYWVLEYNTL